MDDGDVDATVLLETPLLLATVDCTADGDGDGDGWTLSFVRHLAGSPVEVWSMLTDPVRLRDWAPFRPDRDLSTVGPVTTTLRGPAGREPVVAEVTCADHPVVLECTWPDDRIRWTLHPTACGTRVTLQHTFTDQAWAPEAAADWHLCLDAAQRLLVGSDPDPDLDRWQLLDGSRRQRLCDVYRMHLGLAPEADER